MNQRPEGTGRILRINLANIRGQMAERGLTITERSSYVLQGVDAHLRLARLALVDNQRDEAQEHAWAARRPATCNDSPNYTYKVAYEEASELLARLGEWMRG
jgi:hypothetical protein